MRAPERIDLHGWRATLLVERVLAGAAPSADALAIGWEERASQRPARFADRDRVLVALEALPSGSLWSARFPKRDAWAVAARSEAFLRDPDAETLEALGAFLALPSEQREQAPGVSALVALAARGEAQVAASALGRLDRIPGLEARVAEGAAATWSRLLADGSRPLELRRQALALAGRRGLRGVEPALAALAAQASPLQGDAVAALGRLRGGLPPEQARVFLASDDAAVRAGAVRHAGAAIDDATLRRLLAGDPAPAVRAAAVEALVERSGAAALEAVLPLLGDADALVRGAAVRSLATLGAEVVPAVSRVVWAPEAEASGLAGPLATLALAGPEGAVELARVASEHPDEQVRALALFMLGREPPRH